jgi:hypothetical protein
MTEEDFRKKNTIALRFRLFQSILNFHQSSFAQSAQLLFRIESDDKY